MTDTTWTKFHVGRLLVGPVREYLEAERFKGRRIEVLEGRGWLSKDFTIKGSRGDIAHVGGHLQRWFEYLDREHPQ